MASVVTICATLSGVLVHKMEKISPEQYVGNVYTAHSTGLDTQEVFIGWDQLSCLLLFILVVVIQHVCH